MSMRERWFLAPRQGTPVSSMRRKSWNLNRYTTAIFVIHPMAKILGETAASLSRTRASLASPKAMLRILDKLEPLAKLAAMG